MKFRSLVGSVLLCCSVACALAGEPLAPPDQYKLDSDEIDQQYASLLEDLESRSHFDRVAAEIYHPAAGILAEDRDPLDIVLRRTTVLIDDLQSLIRSRDSDAKPLDSLVRSFDQLQSDASGVPVADGQRRRELFADVMRLQRKIAFTNPLLNFDKLLFVKRHRSTFNHMCDQFYGVNAVPGGGVFVITDPFSDDAAVHDLLQEVPVAAGSLAGSRLQSGSFLSPELSFDATQVLFAYVQCEGSKEHIEHLDHKNHGHWDPGMCYHLFSFRINPETLDVSELKQLTDGSFNDFDPCYLPNGRVAFISERRGGYLRCGRACPSYTVFDMRADGSDIRILSPHENNEWQPSVMHDGRILYTRWDYVDRHGCTAHHPWVMTPDGRDSRSMHGNFSIKKDRADMEMDLRAIPGSKKIVGTAAPHHGQAFGSLVIYDPSVPDDDRMGPVKRLTPEVGFPESQGGHQVYGTAWPLSETYFLSVYDAKMRSRHDKQNQAYRRGEYGIYLVDAFGNKTLVYRDPEIACLSPMPLAPRPCPPVIPDESQRLADDPPDDGTMAVINVYDSLMPWPDDTQIKSLRIYQIYPSSNPSDLSSSPHQLGRRIAEAADSNNLARSIIGTVPVEADGSAHFRLPALREVYFQALDQDGLAVQSMRSATWVQPGERLVCYGCHESKHRAHQMPDRIPLALLREPSIPKPDVDGTRPFSYPRLVQGVLDEKCVDCHHQQADQGAPPLDRTLVDISLTSNPNQRPFTTVYRSYASLIHDHAFWSYGDTYRTIPGRFGARASKLYQLLRDGHHDVQLTDEQMHRITVWLDSMSNFYGVYERDGGLEQLRGGIAHPTLE